MNKPYLRPPNDLFFSYTVMFLYPKRPKNVAHDSDAGPPPINAIFLSLFFKGAWFGSIVCLMPICLKTSVANCCNPPMLIAPSSVAAKLQPPTHKSLVGHTMPQVKPSGLSENIAFAAP